MGTEVLPYTQAAVRRAVELLRAGGLVAFPTDTVYGLAARADDPRAVGRIYEAKSRPRSLPLVVQVPSAQDARPWARQWPTAAALLAERFWPGPLTLVVERSPLAIDELTAGGRTVALRVPAHKAALALLRACDFALAVPSANRHAEPAARSGDEALRSLGGAIDLVIDAGPVPLPRAGRPAESTIIDLTHAPPRLLRSGALATEELGRVLGGPVIGQRSS